MRVIHAADALARKLVLPLARAVVEKQSGPDLSAIGIPEVERAGDAAQILLIEAQVVRSGPKSRYALSWPFKHFARP